MCHEHRPSCARDSSYKDMIEYPGSFTEAIVLTIAVVKDAIRDDKNAPEDSHVPGALKLTHLSNVFIHHEIAR